MIRNLVLLYISILVLTVDAQGQKCSNLPVESIPGLGDFWVGNWRYYQNEELSLSIRKNGKVDGGNFKNADCVKINMYKNETSTSAFYYGMMIVKDTKDNCFGCLKLEQRTINVMEFIQSICSYSTAEEAENQCKEVTKEGVGFRQLYRLNRLDVNCKNTFEGVYQFNYESQNNPGICDNPENRITACQEPGSALKDNSVFQQQYKSCPGNSYSKDKRHEWRCLGSWKDPDNEHNTYFAIADDGQQVFRDKIRCGLTTDNQQLPENRLRYTMSATPNCNELAIDAYQGPERVEYLPAFTPDQLEELQPACMMPQNFSGTWYTSSQYDSAVKINGTHMVFNTLYTTFKYVETFFSCQQTRDTRFLMKQVTKGRCEVDYVCFEFLPRHQNIIRFRMGKPFRVRSDFGTASLQNIFRTACSWSAFTISRTENLKYVYQTFILYPPAPVECPIGGIYNFTQIGVPEFKYVTKIRGVTERPRVDYHCDNIESEFKVCAANPKIVNLDVERCATLDHVGRPIGEYDEPDNYLQCAGYWQENQQSYLVTYDTEDPVAPFRCWVYERLGWKDIRMSRALRAACGPNQTPRSYSDVEGASLSLELHENEREFDDCPQRFLDGRDPYMKSTTVYVLNSGISNSVAIATLTLSVLVSTVYIL